MPRYYTVTLCIALQIQVSQVFWPKDWKNQILNNNVWNNKSLIRAYYMINHRIRCIYITTLQTFGGGCSVTFLTSADTSALIWNSWGGRSIDCGISNGHLFVFVCSPAFCQQEKGKVVVSCNGIPLTGTNKNKQRLKEKTDFLLFQLNCTG